MKRLLLLFTILIAALLIFRADRMFVEALLTLSEDDMIEEKADCTIVLGPPLLTAQATSNDINAEDVEIIEKNEEFREICLPVLMYHHFSLNPEDADSITVSPQKFEHDLQALKEAGYNAMLPKELLKAYKENRLPAKPVLITIDDGYFSNYQLAFPILKKMEMKATLFVIGSTIGRDTNLQNTHKITPHFSIEEAKEMVNSGLVSIQPHSYNLHSLANIPNGQAKGLDRFPGENDFAYEQRLLDDTESVKRIIEKEIGDEVIAYSYPYGGYSDIVDKVLRELGFEMTFSVEKGLNQINDNNFFRLKRINMDSDFSNFFL